MRQPEFEQAYDEHLARVYGFLARRVASRQDAEDLTQETFERALRAWGRFDPRRAALSTWLLAIARNLLIDHCRARPPEQSCLEDLYPDALPTVTEVGPRLGLEPELAEAIGELPARDREILALRFARDLSGREISELTGLTLANVQQILSRSLRRLRVVLAS